MPYAVLEKEIERLDETQQNTVVLFVRFLLTQKAAAPVEGSGARPRRYDFSRVAGHCERIQWLSRGASAMNGKRYLLDTNAVIQLLAGNPSLRKMVEDSDFLAISVISKLEFLSYPDLTEDEKIAFYELLEDLTVFDLTASDDALIQEAVAMRIDGGMKLPDAVIAA